MPLGPSLGLALRPGQATLQNPPRILTKSLGSPPAPGQGCLSDPPSNLDGPKRGAGKEFKFLIWPLFCKPWGALKEMLRETTDRKGGSAGGISRQGGEFLDNQSPAFSGSGRIDGFQDPLAVQESERW